MRNRRIYFALGLAVLLAFPGSLFAASQADQQRLLTDAYDSGQLDREQYYLYQLQSIYEPEKLPAEFSLDVTQPMKCGTPIMTEIRRQWETFSEEFRMTASAMAIRPNTQFQYISPDGFFKLHYDTLSGMETPPVPTEDLDSDSIPDFIEDMASYADSSWRQLTVNFGYQQPPSDGTLGGDGLYDLYFDQFQYYGVTNGDFAADSAWDDWSSHIVLHCSFENFPSNQDPEGSRKGSMKVAIGHELYHAVQFYYDAYMDSWWAEQTAVWMEDEIFPGIHDNYNYFDHFWLEPEVSIMDDSDPLHPYGAFVWPKFLTQYVDPGMVKTVLENMAHPSSSLMAEIQTALDLYGTDLGEAFKNFQYWNYTTGSRDVGMHYVDAADYPEIAIMRGHDAVPVFEQWSFAAPYNLGSNYIQVTNDSSYRQILTFSFDTAYAAPWGLAYVTTDTSGEHRYLEASISAEGEGTAYVPYFGRYQSAAFIPYVKGTAIGGPYAFAYNLYFKSFGDADGSGEVDIDDAVWIIQYIFSGGLASDPEDSMDSDCSGDIDIDDVVYLISYIFSDGPAPCEAEP